MKARILQNIAIITLLFIGIKNIWFSLPFRYLDLDQAILKRTLTLSSLSLHHVLTFIVGLLMILLSYNLFKRIRYAWIIEVIALTTSVTTQLFYLHTFTLPIITIEGLVLGILILSYKDFSRQSEKSSVKRALIYFSIALVSIIINTTLGLFLLRGHIHGLKTIWDAFYQTIQLYLFMDTSLYAYKTTIGKLYLDTMLFIYWVTLFISFIALMKPLVYTPIIHKNYKTHARELVMKFGQNPMSYLVLEADKQYLFGVMVEGVCAYTIVGNVMTICGDMICADDDQFVMLSEIVAFANLNHYSLLFMNVTDHFLKLYDSAKFGLLKCGEDACFDLNTYNLKGGAVAKVRAAINHAVKDGIEVHEFDPSLAENEPVLKQIKEISSEWVSNKNAPELIFMLGSNNFNAPLDRRYFYAMHPDGTVLGYVVFNPYKGGKAYLAEITRRRTHAPQGVLEKIIFDAFMKMKDEGVLEGSLGLSPLYNVSSDGAGNISEKLFSYIYEHLNQFYDFKSLHHAKEKYAPTIWLSRYYAFYPKPFLPQYAYAIVRSQLPHKVSKLLVDLLIEHYVKGGKSNDD